MTTHSKILISFGVLASALLGSIAVADSATFAATAQAWYQDQCVGKQPKTQNAALCFVYEKVREHDTHLAELDQARSTTTSQLNQHSAGIAALNSSVGALEARSPTPLMLGRWVGTFNGGGSNYDWTALSVEAPGSIQPTTKLYVPVAGKLTKVTIQCGGCSRTQGSASVRVKLNGNVVPVSASLDASHLEFAVGTPTSPIGVNEGNTIELDYSQASMAASSGNVGIFANVLISPTSN